MQPHFAKFKSPADYRKFLKKISKPEFSATQRVELWQHLGKNDLFFLLRYILNRKDVDNDWYFARCREVQNEPDACIDLWAREHGKSTTITYAKSIQDIINDPEITIGIFSHTRPISKGFLRQIKRELEGNEKLKKLYPDVFYAKPETESPMWSEEGGITVRRKGNPKEATVEAWGLVDGQPTGRHFKLRVYDDVVTRENVTTVDQIEKTTDAFELSDNLGMIGGTFRIIGTRYHLNDTYSSILRKGAAKPRIYPATHNGRMDGNPVLFSQEEWERKKKTQSRKIIAAQLLQNPLADEDARFQPVWLSSYEIRPLLLNIYIMGDPSLGRGKDSDNTAIVAIGYGVGGTKYLIDGFCHRMPLSERWQRLKELYMKWSVESGVQSINVGWERYGLQSDSEYFEERMRIEDIHFAIDELNWSNNSGQSKGQRIDRLEPDFRNRRLLLPKPVWHEGQAKTWNIDSDPESKLYQSVVYKNFSGLSKKQQELFDGGQENLLARAIKRIDNEKQVYDLTLRLIDEYISFPFGAHDDLLDAMSRMYDMNMIEPTSYNSSYHASAPVFFDT